MEGTRISRDMEKISGMPDKEHPGKYVLEQETHKQAMYMYPSAQMEFQVFSAGMYAIKHLPRSALFRKTSPPANRSDSHAFLEDT